MPCTVAGDSERPRPSVEGACCSTPAARVKRVQCEVAAQSEYADQCMPDRTRLS